MINSILLQAMNKGGGVSGVIPIMIIIILIAFAVWYLVARKRNNTENRLSSNSHGRNGAVAYKSNLGMALRIVGVIGMALGIICGMKIEMPAGLAVIVGSIVSGLVTFGLAKCVDAADKYLKGE